MKKILMVCLGNICRSPIAEGILQDKLKQRGLPAIVDSAGTSGWHAGEPPDQRAIEVCLKHKIDIRKQRSRLFTPDDFKHFDLIFTMDSANFISVNSMATSQADRKKVKLILSEIDKEVNADIPDPYYGGDDGFENVYQMLNNATEAIIKNHF